MAPAKLALRVEVQQKLWARAVLGLVRLLAAAMGGALAFLEARDYGVVVRPAASRREG